MIYARERFHNAQKELSEAQQYDYSEMADKPYRSFEACVTYHIMPEKIFDFSDPKPENVF